MSGSSREEAPPPLLASDRKEWRIWNADSPIKLAPAQALEAVDPSYLVAPDGGEKLERNMCLQANRAGGS